MIIQEFVKSTHFKLLAKINSFNPLSALLTYTHMGRFFGRHGNGCQGNQSLDIFQPLWSKGPPSHKISLGSGRKHLRYPETNIRSVLY